MKLSAQERQRRSDLARRLHAEGRLGSPAVARRAQAASAEARRRRASAVAQRLVAEHADAIERTLIDALRRGTRAQRLKAAEMVLKLGLSAERLDLGEAREEREHMDREQLLDVLTAKLQSGPAAQVLRHAIEAKSAPVIDSTAVELSD